MEWYNTHWRVAARRAPHFLSKSLAFFRMAGVKLTNLMRISLLTASLMMESLVDDFSTLLRLSKEISIWQRSGSTSSGMMVSVLSFRLSFCRL